MIMTDHEYFSFPQDDIIQKVSIENCTHTSSLKRTCIDLEFDIVDVFKIYVLITDFLLMEDDNFVVAGQVGILDLTNCTAEHFAQFKPDIIKKMT